MIREGVILTTTPFYFLGSGGWMGEERKSLTISAIIPSVRINVKEVIMTRHQITITEIPRMIVGANDVIFEVRENDTKLGDLKVSQGNLFWLSSGHNYGRILEWSQFAQLAEEHGKRRRYTP